jgi:hypothetical protein
MGWCFEFGPSITDCDHPMQATSDSCTCSVCGTVCRGRFKGCAAVWAAGPRSPASLKAQSRPSSRLPLRSAPPAGRSAPTPEARPEIVVASAQSADQESRLQLLVEVIERQETAIARLVKQVDVLRVHVDVDTLKANGVTGNGTGPGSASHGPNLAPVADPSQG